MAALIQNQNKDWYKIVACTRREWMAYSETFGDCHLCGDEVYLDDLMYYIPVLNVAYCERCYKLWATSAMFYKVDLKIETENLQKIKRAFKEMGCWDEN